MQKELSFIDRFQSIGCARVGSLRPQPLYRRALRPGLTVLALQVFAANTIAQRGPEVTTPPNVAIEPQRIVISTPAPNRKIPFTPSEIRFAPPKPKNAKIKWLEREEKEGKALLTVEFDPADAQRLRGSDGLRLGEFKASLHDDGKGGDEKANDGVFSSLVRVDFAEIAKEAQANRNAPISDKPVPVFEGRVKVSETKTKRFDASTLKPGGIIEISKLGFLPPNPFPLPEIDHSLLVTDTSVVDDARAGGPCGAGAAMGKWSFGYLMTQMANQPQTGIDPSLFVRRWLARWETTQQVNDQQVAERGGQIRNRIIIPWENASGGQGAPLDLAKAPFRLLAIVNRIDLRDNFAYGGGGGSAGEARFVFCAVDVTNGCEPMRFTVIFEYGIKKASCNELKAWGQQWAKLSTLDFGPTFNNALEAITEQFAKAGADPTRLPNRSALNQLRTNENALAVKWQIREFTIDSTSVVGHLAESTVKQTPGPPFHQSTILTDYVNANVSAVLADKHVVPAIVMSPGITPFLGGEAITAPPRADWDGSPPIADRNARFHFSLNTCNGCHGGETFPNGAPFFFTHIEPRKAGDPSRLSSFLAGHLATALPGSPDVPVTDPADTTPSRTFNDLARRQVELQRVLSLNCKFPFPELFFEPLRMVH